MACFTELRSPLCNALSVSACCQLSAQLFVNQLQLPPTHPPIFPSTTQPPPPGIFAAQLINYGTKNIEPWGWRLSLALAGVPGVMLFIGALCLPDTPNRCACEGGDDKWGCVAVVRRLRFTRQVSPPSVLVSWGMFALSSVFCALRQASAFIITSKHC